jgi:nicotinamide-nucleotide amidase
MTLAYLPGLDGVDLRLTAWSLPAVEAEARLSAGEAHLRSLAGESVYGTGDEDLAALMLERARARGWSLVTAESCTGGGVGERLTAIPGSSDVYLGGVVAYHDRMKRELLDVPAELIAQHGAVSAAVAEAMAIGATRRFEADLAISVTGVAGPGGGSPTKPVGLVFVGTVVRGEHRVTEYRLPGGRADVRHRAGQAALFQLFRRLLPK